MFLRKGIQGDALFLQLLYGCKGMKKQFTQNATCKGFAGAGREKTRDLQVGRECGGLRVSVSPFLAVFDVMGTLVTI